MVSSNKKLNETSQNQTRRMRQQTSPDSLLLNLWGRSVLPNFLIEKARSIPKTVNKTRNGNSIVEVDSWKQAEGMLKMKTFHTTKRRAYPHEKLNTSKRASRSRDLALATEEEMSAAMGKQEITNIRRVSIKKG